MPPTEVTTKGNILVARSGYANVHGDELVLVTGVSDWGEVGFFVAEEFLPDAERIARGSEPGPHYFPKIFVRDQTDALASLAKYCEAHRVLDAVGSGSVWPLDPKILELRRGLEACRTALFKATREKPGESVTIAEVIRGHAEAEKAIDAALARAAALIGTETMPEPA